MKLDGVRVTLEGVCTLEPLDEWLTVHKSGGYFNTASECGTSIKAARSERVSRISPLMLTMCCSISYEGADDGQRSARVGMIRQSEPFERCAVSNRG